ncbi:hypothetical protein ACJX0J_024709, partial [Zea mays]
SCNAIICENENEPTKSSDVVETKRVEALVPSSVGTIVTAEQKDNGHRASGEWHGDNVQVIGQQQKIYIIKVPKFAGDDLWNKIQAAQAHLDHLTQERDAINRRRQKQKDVCDQYREKLEAARREEWEARNTLGDKKNDLNNVRSVLGKLHQANSVEELDELNEYFFRYRDDQNAIEIFRANGDINGLKSHCGEGVTSTLTMVCNNCAYFPSRFIAEDEHDVVWFWLQKDKPHECPVYSQYFV